MSQQFNPIEVAKLPYTKRNEILNSTLQFLLSLDENTIVKTLTDVLTVLASKATDEEYKNWCDSMLRLVSMYDDKVIKAIVTLRMKAVSNLPKNLAERDSKILNEVLSNLDPSVKEKIIRNIK
ncbi:MULTISPECIES: hypothetical protein [Sulfurisphaera]|uniref:Uncharacterized protein n=3 Tax=Sulfurisphaera TaxID=69655 RepID=Q96YD5_SULTO|nr:MULTISPECIES: hypothetical protein [Sulfurisphaera]MBB5253980.1 hypothetical protein [Sulfurisphaera ohwakuensis]QGR17863.1 hypothetical protein D1869_12280 [Sulfurisphaera ohwakuensis]BAB67342.1 hypothetical protein STK_22330 [Sulfurisphaera tokodaii str. 7]HII73152.1 hypothetical protein [Sulfurisphaera tokodaii]